MSKNYETHFVDLEDFEQKGRYILCPDPDCDGRFENGRLATHLRETVEVYFDCTHCRKKLYICHEQPSSIAVDVPEDEQPGPVFA